MTAEAAREQVIDTCVELADLGYLAGTGGNVAIRVDAEHFAVTPSARDYYGLELDDIAVVRIEDGAQVEGRSQASVESGLHAAVFRAQANANASFHTHQPVASAFTLLGVSLVPRKEAHRELLGESVPHLGYAPSGTAWLATRVGAAFDAGCHACLMRNHGIVCVGFDADEATRRVRALEAECAEQFLDGLEQALSPEVDATARAFLLRSDREVRG